MNNPSIVWTDKAKSQLNSVYDFIAKESPQAALKIVFILLNHVGFLKNFPEAGKVDESLKSLKLHHRFLIKGNYKIVYRLIENESTILIIAVFDTRQNPKKLKKLLK